MHIAVCDDNQDELFRISSLLELYCRECDNTVTYEAFHNAIELIESIKTRRFDLLLLDILMPGITGMDAAKEIRSFDSDIPIIFLTSSREFAVESYRVGAKDYIMKPARKDEIFPSLRKHLASLPKEEAYLTIKNGNGIVKLLFTQIVYVEVVNRLVQFTLTNGEIREAYGYLSDYEENLLVDTNFYKPHRSYIVNLSQVTELDKSGFVTIMGNVVPVAREAYTKAKTAYMKYLLAPKEGRDIQC